VYGENVAPSLELTALVYCVLSLVGLFYIPVAIIACLPLKIIYICKFKQRKHEQRTQVKLLIVAAY
jgi:hypothetical protein